MRVGFVASVSAVAADPARSRSLYVDALGLPLEEAEQESGYVYSEAVEGAKHFGVWPLAHAARACFGTDDWPPDRPVPQASIEFDVGSPEAVASGARELAEAGFAPLHEPREEPWGQHIARVQSPEGMIVGLSYAPWQHP